MPNHLNRTRNLKIVSDAPPKVRREKTVSELMPASRQAYGRGCRCSVMDFGVDVVIVLPLSCPHHQGLSFWNKKERRGYA